MKSSCLFGEIRLEITDEACQLLRALDRKQKVVVVRQHNECMESDSVKPLCPTKHPDEQAIEISRGPQQESTLDGPIRDFDEAASRRDETKATSHIHARRNPAQTSVKKEGGT